MARHRVNPSRLVLTRARQLQRRLLLPRSEPRSLLELLLVSIFVFGTPVVWATATEDVGVNATHDGGKDPPGHNVDLDDAWPAPAYPTGPVAWPGPERRKRRVIVLRAAPPPPESERAVHEARKLKSQVPQTNVTATATSSATAAQKPEKRAMSSHDHPSAWYFKESISSGRFHSCAIKSSGTVCWGRAEDAAAATGTAQRQVSSSGHYTCATDAAGDVECWGHSDRAAPPADTAFLQISSGEFHGCGIKAADQQVACWGNNNNPATQVGQATPPSGGDQFLQISSSRTHTCGILADGTQGASCWGSNEFGKSTPPADVGFLQVSTGGSFTCGILDDDTKEVNCWGYNADGQATPPSGVGFLQISAGGFHVCGVKSDGTDEAACWACGNPYTQVGQAEPPAGIGFLQVSSGDAHTCGVKSDGTKAVACWGDNFFGQATPPSDLGAVAIELAEVCIPNHTTCSGVGFCAGGEGYAKRCSSSPTPAPSARPTLAPSASPSYPQVNWGEPCEYTGDARQPITRRIMFMCIF